MFFFHCFAKSWAFQPIAKLWTVIVVMGSCRKFWHSHTKCLCPLSEVFLHFLGLTYESMLNIFVSLVDFSAAFEPGTKISFDQSYCMSEGHRSMRKARLWYFISWQDICDKVLLDFKKRGEDLREQVNKPPEPPNQNMIQVEHYELRKKVLTETVSGSVDETRYAWDGGVEAFLRELPHVTTWCNTHWLIIEISICSQARGGTWPRSRRSPAQSWSHHAPKTNEKYSF